MRVNILVPFSFKSFHLLFKKLFRACQGIGCAGFQPMVASPHTYILGWEVWGWVGIFIYRSQQMSHIPSWLGQMIFESSVPSRVFGVIDFSYFLTKGSRILHDARSSFSDHFPQIPRAQLVHWRIGNQDHYFLRCRILIELWAFREWAKCSGCWIRFNINNAYELGEVVEFSRCPVAYLLWIMIFGQEFAKRAYEVQTLCLRSLVGMMPWALRQSLVFDKLLFFTS